MVEQLLRSKREELVTAWEDREKRLEAIRLKEKAREQRVRKRRRIDDQASAQRDVDDEEAEWLLDDPGDAEGGSEDPFSGLSKETREVLTRLGLVGSKKPEAAEEEEQLAEEIKVRMPEVAPLSAVVTAIDILHIKNAFSAVAVHHRATAPYLPTLLAELHDEGGGRSDRGCETTAPFFTTKTLYQPCRIEAWLGSGNQ